MLRARVRSRYTNDGGEGEEERGKSGQKSGSNLSDSYVFIGTPFLRPSSQQREEGEGRGM